MYCTVAWWCQEWLVLWDGTLRWQEAVLLARRLMTSCPAMPKWCLQSIERFLNAGAALGDLFHAASFLRLFPRCCCRRCWSPSPASCPGRPLRSSCFSFSDLNASVQEGSRQLSSRRLLFWLGRGTGKREERGQRERKNERGRERSDRRKRKGGREQH